MQSTVKKRARATKVQEIQPADNFFLDKCKFFSLPFKLLKSRYPPLFADMAIRRATHCWTVVIFITLNPKIKI